MHFIGTRKNEKVEIAQAIVNPFSNGGGLYVPEEIPVLSDEEKSAFSDYDYFERASVILNKFFGEFGKEWIEDACKKAFPANTDPAVLTRVDEGTYVLELYKGRTCSDKDISVALFPALFQKAKEILSVKEKTLFLNATTGDEGIAVIDAFKEDPTAFVACFYPSEGVSKMQAFQMTVQESENAYVAGIADSMDECQRLVKKMCTSENFTKKSAELGFKTTSANSYNIARVIPEIVPFFSAYYDLVATGQIDDGEKIDFAVSGGNGTNLLAGWYAKKMGLPVRFITASSNRNKGLSEFFQKGVISLNRTHKKTIEPSLDIAFPIQAERFLYYAVQKNGKRVETLMNALDETGECRLEENEYGIFSEDFYAGYASEDDVVEAMYCLFDDYGYPTDVQTGVAQAVYVAFRSEGETEDGTNDDDTKVVLFAGVNPYKYPQDVLYAISGNDVKDSFKGVKRLNLLTAMKPPKFLTDNRYKSVVFKDVLPPEGKKISEKLLTVLQAK